MERGEMTPDEKLQDATTTDPAVAATANEKPDEESVEQTMIDSSQELEDRAKAENIPDGTDTVSEWQEGSHKVIERRTGPGEEVRLDLPLHCRSCTKLTILKVEVEVIRNAFAPGEEQNTSAFRGNERSVPHFIAARIDRAIAGNAPHENDPAFDETEDDSIGDATIQKGLKTTPQAISPLSTGIDEKDEEEGWASDRSAGSQQSGSAIHAVDFGSDGKKRTKPQKKKPTIKSIPLGKGRRRNSMRKGLLGQARQIMDHKSPPPAQRQDESEIKESDSEGDEPERGRRSIMIPESSSAFGPSTGAIPRPRTADSSRQGTATSSRPSTARSSIRHLRADAIRAEARSREHSPSRSIRFADEDRPGSGTTTPTARHSLLFNGNTNIPSGSTAHERSPSDDVDFGTGRVTFDLSREGTPKP
jgi:sodium/hydrogen antiporter